MVDQFTIGFKTQRWWGSLAALDFFLGGTGAGAFIFSMYLGIVPGMALGWVAVALGAVALLVDLGKPGRFLRAGSRVGRSWISRGVMFTTIFLLFGLLRLATEWTAGLPWNNTDTLGQTISVIATIGALGVMLYTGFLLSQSPSIPFWNTTILPLLFALSGFTSGMGVTFVLVAVLGTRDIDPQSAGLMGMALLGSSLVFVWTYLLTTASSTLAARESVRMLVKGQMAFPFLVGATLVGLIVPLVLAVAVYLNSGSGTAFPLMGTIGVLVLVGGYFFRYSVVKAGVYPPVIDL